MKEIVDSNQYPKGFQSIFQTNEEWVKVFMEVVAVNSAIYGIVFSLVLCVFSVAVFTANACLTLIVMVTILGMYDINLLASNLVFLKTISLTSNYLGQCVNSGSGNKFTLFYSQVLKLNSLGCLLCVIDQA